MPRPAFPGLALALGTIWLLAGALYKLFEGHPADLPQSVVDLSPFKAWNTFRFAIVAELAVIALVISMPRLGWVLLAGVFGTFIAVLWPLVAEGATSCGCFGGTVTIAPTTMMIVDGSLLLLILVSRPWRMHKASGLGPLAAIPLLAAAAAGPMLKLPMPEKVQPRTEIVTDPQGSEPAREMIPATTPAAPLTAAAPQGVGGPETTATDATNPTEGTENPALTVEPVEAPPAHQEPSAPGLPTFMQLNFKSMEGQDLTAQDFYQIADQTQGFIDVNSHVVVYRDSCEVCEEHLKDLSAELLNGDPKWQGKTIVLMRIVEDIDSPSTKKVTILPEPSQKVSLPALERGYLVTTPLSFDVDEAFLIQSVVDVREELGH